MSAHQDTIRVGQIRIQPERGKLEDNFNNLMKLLDGIAPGSVDMLVTSECYLDGYMVLEESLTPKDLLNYAIEPQTSPYAAKISEKARQLRSGIILGCSRRATEGVYNSALIYDRTGKLVGMYDKVHCQSHDKKFIAGKCLPVFESDFGLFGIMICADRRWPETVRTLALKGARVIFNPTFGMHNDLNQRMMQTRSYESEVFIAFSHAAQSLLTDPKGEILCNERTQPGISITPVDLSVADKVRQGESAHLKDRQADLYKV